MSDQYSTFKHNNYLYGIIQSYNLNDVITIVVYVYRKRDALRVFLTQMHAAILSFLNT